MLLWMHLKTWNFFQQVSSWTGFNKTNIKNLLWNCFLQADISTPKILKYCQISRMSESHSEGRGNVDFSVFPVLEDQNRDQNSENSCQIFGFCPHFRLIFRNQCVFNSYPLLLHKKKRKYGIFWIFFAPCPPFWAFPCGIPSAVSETSPTPTRLPEPVKN